MKYKPETGWKKDGNLIYNLRQDGWDKGKPRMVNDVAVSIQCRHLPKKIQADIVDTVLEALNINYTMHN